VRVNADFVAAVRSDTKLETADDYNINSLAMVFAAKRSHVTTRTDPQVGSLIVSATSIPRLSSVDGGGAVRCFRISALRALA
jgi:hypothetical protein